MGQGGRFVVYPILFASQIVQIVCASGIPVCHQGFAVQDISRFATGRIYIGR